MFKTAPRPLHCATAVPSQATTLIHKSITVARSDRSHPQSVLGPWYTPPLALSQIVFEPAFLFRIEGQMHKLHAPPRSFLPLRRIENIVDQPLEQLATEGLRLPTRPEEGFRDTARGHPCEEGFEDFVGFDGGLDGVVVRQREILIGALLAVGAERGDDLLGESGDEDGFREVVERFFVFAAVHEPDAVDEDAIFPGQVDGFGEGCGGRGGVFVMRGDIFEDVVEDALLVGGWGRAFEDLFVEFAEVLVGFWGVDFRGCHGDCSQRFVQHS